MRTFTNKRLPQRTWRRQLQALVRLRTNTRRSDLAFTPRPEKHDTDPPTHRSDAAASSQAQNHLPGTPQPANELPQTMQVACENEPTKRDLFQGKNRPGEVFEQIDCAVS